MLIKALCELIKKQIKQKKLLFKIKNFDVSSFFPCDFLLALKVILNNCVYVFKKKLAHNLQKAAEP